MSLASQLLEVPSADPEDARRRRLLNILLVGTAGLALVTLIAMTVVQLAGIYRESASLIYVGCLVILVGNAIILAINRYWSGLLASSLFLLLLTLAFAFNDTPEEVVRGRGLFMFAIPILMASVLLRPYASFIVAGLIGLLISGIELFSLHSLPNVPAIAAFVAIALVSWLSARSLEHALADLRTINRDLDQRVDERTHDLAEALAREHAEASKNQAVLTGIADGVIVFGTDGKAIVANPSIERLLERSSDVIIGTDIETMMGKEVDIVDKETVVALLADQEVPRSSVKFPWGEKTLSVSFAPVRDAADKVTGTVAVFRDFTLEAEVDRMKSDFVSIVSHELRTPLTSIKGYLDLILIGASGPVTKQQKSFLSIARDNAGRLNEMVTDLLDISRIEAGKVDLNVQVVSIPRIVEQVIDSLRKEFQDRKLTVASDMQGDLPEIFGDPNRISQIVFNLLSNACKYTSEGGATVRARLVDDAIQIDVVDTGIGISAGAQEKLFSRFFRVDDPFVRQQPGTGLGLHITRSLVEMHGGRIWLQSKPGTGSTFSFTLPLPVGLVRDAAMKEARKGTPAVQPEPISLPAGPWILVADDEPDVARLFQLQLEKEGYRVTVVTQGSRVLDIARQLQPELITLDLLMDVDGLTILQQLKADPQTSKIPVVVVSVVPDVGRGLASGAAGYLVKPLQEKELLNCVGQVLGTLSGGTRNKILVVDDEEDIVSWLKHVLTHYGFDVTEAYDGVQALESVATDKPDLVLLDLKMPRLDGRATIRRLREQEETRSLPIIVFTATQLSDEAERDQLLSMGVKEFLHKSVTIERLVSEVQEHLKAQ
jgi:signal transduction histidine kinase/CheY-like chemotaxis protein